MNTNYYEMISETLNIQKILQEFSSSRNFNADEVRPKQNSNIKGRQMLER